MNRNNKKYTIKMIINNKNKNKNVNQKLIRIELKNTNRK